MPSFFLFTLHSHTTCLPLKKNGNLQQTELIQAPCEITRDFLSLQSNDSKLSIVVPDCTKLCCLWGWKFSGGIRQGHGISSELQVKYKIHQPNKCKNSRLSSEKKPMLLSQPLGFPCGSAGKESACNVPGSIPRLGRSPGEGKGYPLQYSGLQNGSPRQLSNFHFHFNTPAPITTIQFSAPPPSSHTKKGSPGLQNFRFLKNLKTRYFFKVFSSNKIHLHSIPVESNKSLVRRRWSLSKSLEGENDILFPIVNNLTHLTGEVMLVFTVFSKVV